MSDDTRSGGRIGAAVLVALVLAACAFAYAISVARADSGTSPAQSAAPAATQPVQQEGEDSQPPAREDCPEKDGDGGGGSSGSSGSSDSDLRF